MYVILVYDIGQKRVGKMLKLCRKYLNWIQNSVFEGEITPSKLLELKCIASEILKKEEDSLIIFSSRQNRWLEKEIIGKELGKVDIFLCPTTVVMSNILPRRTLFRVPVNDTFLCKAIFEILGTQRYSKVVVTSQF